jgi:hypothetical protein
VKEKLEDDVKLLDSLLAKILLEQGTKSYANSDVIIRGLRISAVLFIISIGKLIKSGLAQWNGTGHGWVNATEKGLLYAYENKLVT